jgi:hypothetical protein
VAGRHGVGHQPRSAPGGGINALQQGEPSVVALRTPMGVTIVTWMMATGEEKIVAKRLKEVLTKARSTAHLHPQRTESELAALRQTIRSTSGTPTLRPHSDLSRR